MNVQKYIIYKNIDRFKSMMIDRTQKTFIEFNTYEHYTTQYRNQGTEDRYSLSL